jgi:hypothetical protein
MKVRHLFLAASGVLMLSPLASQAHEVPNMPHTHAFEQNGYETVPQSRSVNNQLGSIIIKSPQPQTGYQTGTTVNFARPEPMTKAPGSPVAKTRYGSKVNFARPEPITRAPGSPVATTESQKDPAKNYGKGK